ncbi:MAG: hypothetical protein M3400_06245, partial [Actinomycetota bacterium]|nr:hypothetical protein [Actinomycetota bacterium]
LEAANQVARLTTPAVAAAVCAALAAGIDPARLDAVIDLAGSLMLIGSPDGAGSLEEELSAGHVAAVGWLATVLLDAGIRAPAEALELTLGVVGLCGTARKADPPPPDVQGADPPVLAQPGRYPAPDVVRNSALWAFLR